MKYVTLLPAYGRDYTSQAAVKKDWGLGLDFQICCIGHKYDGRYINKEQAEDGVQYSVRYNHKQKLVIL